MAEKPVDGLSKGMKQRLCLGRALIHDPKVLILDEPAAGLDPRARIELREMIGELASRGKSLLISSHILTELAEMCDRVGIIEQGQMLAVGTVDEILEAHSHGDDVGERDLLIVTAVVLSDLEVAAKWLREREGVAKVEVLGNLGEQAKGNESENEMENRSGTRFETRSGNGPPRIQFTFSRDLQRQADLLAAMIGAEIRVASFAGKQKSLEEAFLKVTQGRVQ
jgi:ABC-2 type transport system ATP-binding protein